MPLHIVELGVGGPSQARASASPSAPSRPEGDASQPTIVLIHGALDRHNAFRRVARRLSGRRVLAYDRRGYGRSVSMPAATDFTQHVADLLSVVSTASFASEAASASSAPDPPDSSRRAVRPVVAVGHSYGGLVAIAAAAEFPKRFAAVGAFEPPTPWKSWWPRSEMDPGPGTPSGELVEWFYRSMVGGAAWDRLSAAVRSELCAEGEALRTDLQVGRDGPVFDAAAVTLPVLIGYGGHSTSRHKRAAQELASDLQNASMMVLEDGAHGAHRSHPDAFAHFIEACTPPD